MRHTPQQAAVWAGFLLATAALGCGDDERRSVEASWLALMEDGDVASVAPGAMSRPTPTPTPTPPPPRFCPNDDCRGFALAFWAFDDCNPFSTELQDSGFTSSIKHPAFRAVSVPCVSSIDGLGVQLSREDDIVYAPDQPDFVFNQGLTVAAWINPDRITGTQSLVRKRLEGSSSFLLAIDGRRLNFILRLTNGRVVNVSAPVRASRFTHVAATYDGENALLYLDGVLAARARGVGTIAPGAGPILVGNDANGRQFKGVIDDVWLDTLAAPPEVVGGLTCLRKAPLATLSPSETPPTPGGVPVAFDLNVTNPSGPTCPAATYQFFGSLPFQLTADPTFGALSVPPGGTEHSTIAVSALEGSDAGSFPFVYFVADIDNFSLQSTATATFVVAPPAPPTRTGCAPAPTQPVAPGGYYVNGNTVCTADGRPHIFHGVARPSLEFLSGGSNISLHDFQLMGTWNANVVRIALNQDFWIAESPIADPNYQALVADAVRWAEMAGMDVILDLHWSDRGVLGSCFNSPTGCQQLMPDTNSLTFWSEVAAQYRNDGRVAFELYNEPHGVSWDVWRNGGITFERWQAVGMQQLYDTVRSTGARNLVFIGGLDFAYDLSGVPASRIDGYNIVYVTHPYRAGAPQREPDQWGRFWGFLTRTDPVVVTEFGVLNDFACTTDYDSQLIQYADAHFAGWTAWAWFPGGCTFPAIIDDWAGTPSPTGAIVKPALLSYNDPSASPPLPGPGPVPAVRYLFDRSAEGWVLSTFDAPGNLGVQRPPGVPGPVVSFDAADGDPVSGPGSVKVTATYTGLDQYVDTDVVILPPGHDLAGTAVHVMVRLVSGSFPEGGVLLYALSGSTFDFTSVFVGADQFPVGAWVPVTLDLATGAVPPFDPGHVVQIGLQFLSGSSAGGGAYTGSGETVFEIDTVVD